LQRFALRMLGRTRRPTGGLGRKPPHFGVLGSLRTVRRLRTHFRSAGALEAEALARFSSACEPRALPCLDAAPCDARRAQILRRLGA
jgi:hypothetical protein